MPNEEPNVPGNGPDPLLLQLLSALINNDGSQAALPPVNAHIPAPQQPYGSHTEAIPPLAGFSGFDASLPALHPPPAHHRPQLPYASSMDFDESDNYEGPQFAYQNTGVRTVLDKKERVRLKNRLAQQRFRERRRVLQRQTQDQYDTIAAEFDALELENEALKEEERALIKLYHVKHHFLRGMTAIKEMKFPLEQHPHQPHPTSASGEDKDKEKDAQDVQEKEDASVAKGNNPSNSTTVGERLTETGFFSKISLSLPASQLPAISLQYDTYRTKLNSNIQQWQLRIGQLMENAAISGFSSAEIKILEAETQHQLEQWQQLANKNSFEYAKMLHCLLAPLDTRASNNAALEAGTVGPETLTAVVSGISASSIVELQKLKQSYDTSVNLGYNALIKWKKELLPLLTLLFSNESSSSGGLSGSSGGGSDNNNKLKNMGHCELATKHVMAVAGIAHLHALEMKLNEAIRLIGPAWSRVSGPLNAALCHLETAPYVPTPDKMIQNILTKYQLSMMDMIPMMGEKKPA